MVLQGENLIFQVENENLTVTDTLVDNMVDIRIPKEATWILTLKNLKSLIKTKKQAKMNHGLIN